MPSYTVSVKTGDKKKAGTNANVKLKLHDSEGRSTEHIKLDVFFRNDFERGNTDVFSVTDDTPIGPTISKVELWRDNAGWLKNPDWYVEFVKVETETKEVFVFPFNRWVVADLHYVIQQYDALLPKDDPYRARRKFELREKRKLYEYNKDHPHPDSPVQIKELPDDEQFSDDYKWDLDSTKLKLLAEIKLIDLLTSSGDWDSFDDLSTLFDRIGWSIERPKSIAHWKEDKWFGAQRLSGCNPHLIQLCQHIPETLGVTSEMLEPFLEGMTLTAAMETKRIYMVDLKILDGIKKKDGFVVPAPIVLFFVTSDKSLVPIAIQLFQQKAPDNPVFLPNDDPNLWLLAKMWYNLADATYHQSLSHLGFTHLMMAGFSVCTQRTLANSHPIYRLLAPHFLYLLAINWLALARLVSADGFVAKTMSVGHTGMLELIPKAISSWRFDTDAHLPNNLKTRGVSDPETLPNFAYRDDGLLVWSAIQTYVEKVVCLYYENDGDVTNDIELAQWGKELAAPYPDGVQIRGLPGDGKFTTRDQLIQVCTGTIFTCSAIHAAVNFCQFDEYAFIPNYPGQLHGNPPTDKTPQTEAALLSILPNKQITLETILVVRILSTKATNSLGDFEEKYLYHPKAEKACKELVEELRQASNIIKERNKSRVYPYDVLDPETIPNAISI